MGGRSVHVNGVDVRYAMFRVVFDREGPRCLCGYFCRAVTYATRGTGRGGPSDDSGGTPEATKW